MKNIHVEELLDSLRVGLSPRGAFRSGFVSKAPLWTSADRASIIFTHKDDPSEKFSVVIEKIMPMMVAPRYDPDGGEIEYVEEETDDRMPGVPRDIKAGEPMRAPDADQQDH